MGLVLFLALGAAAGVIASKVLDAGLALGPAVGFGIAGAFLGWLVKLVFVAVTGLIFTVVFALVGAGILIWVWKRVSK